MTDRKTDCGSVSVRMNKVGMRNLRLTCVMSGVAALKQHNKVPPVPDLLSRGPYTNGHISHNGYAYSDTTSCSSSSTDDSYPPPPHVTSALGPPPTAYTSYGAPPPSPGYTHPGVVPGSPVPGHYYGGVPGVGNTTHGGPPPSTPAFSSQPPPPSPGYTSHGVPVPPSSSSGYIPASPCSPHRGRCLLFVCMRTRVGVCGFAYPRVMRERKNISTLFKISFKYHCPPQATRHTHTNSSQPQWLAVCCPVVWRIEGTGHHCSSLFIRVDDPPPILSCM